MAFDPVAYLNTPRWLETRLGLDRICALLNRLDRPQDQLKFVHVAGTNGKGSACAYLASILQEAGYKTGLFTSPYLITFEERIRIDGQSISLEDLSEITLAVQEQAEALAAEMGEHPTEFELMTAVALLYFARNNCDIVVLEVGLGGRLDSTNVIEKPEVSVITRLGLDHTDILGKTLDAIAREKAGIIKVGVPVVSWPQEDEAMTVIEEIAASANAPLTVVNLDEVKANPVTWGASGQPVRTFSYGAYTNLQTYLVGSYQPENAALAIQVIQVLRDRAWNIPDKAVIAGIEAARCPARFEVITNGPNNTTIVIDGAHNLQGTEALIASLEEVFPGRKPVYIIGVLADKDYPAMLEKLLPTGDGFIAITPQSPRALSAYKLARAIRWTGQDLLGCAACTRAYDAKDTDDALNHALEIAGSGGLICVCGSLYNVASIKATLARMS